MNGTQVGSFVTTSSSTVYANDWTFAPIGGVNGADYTIRLEQMSSTIPNNAGSTALVDVQSTYSLTNAVTAAPEPATLVLIAPALVAAGIVRRRKPPVA